MQRVRVSVLVAVVLAGLEIAAEAQPSATPTEFSYRVGTGDVLTVETFDHKEVSGVFSVEDDGSILFPLLDRVPVVGLSASEVARLLERLLERDYYVDVIVKVEVKEYHSRPVTVLGEVAKPGTVFLEGPTTLTEILVAAGGLRSTAGPQVDVRRVERVDGREITKVYSFSTEKLLSGEQGREFEVMAGDIVAVSARQVYFITGEINRAGQFEIGRGLTLMQAISQAGGPSKFASNAVEIHRDLDGQKTILEFDLGDIRRGKVEDVEIMPGDVITLKRRFF